MPDTKFNCGDIVVINDFSRYNSTVSFIYRNERLPIVGIHPIGSTGVVDFNDPNIQYLVRGVRNLAPNYPAFVGLDLIKVGHIDYRSIFGRFKYDELMTMLNNPANPVEQYMFWRCHQALEHFTERCQIPSKAVLSIRNVVKGNKDYFTGVSKDGSIKIAIVG